jgi:hypothetical protein
MYIRYYDTNFNEYEDIYSWIPKYYIERYLLKS